MEHLDFIEKIHNLGIHLSSTNKISYVTNVSKLSSYMGNGRNR